MYGQGNYAHQFCQGPARPSAFQHSHNAPHPSSNVGPGPIALPPPMIHQGSSAGLPQVVQPGHPPIYQHGPPAPPPPVQQGGPPPPPQSIQVPSPLVVNTGQPYLHPPSSGYLNSTSIQQNAQYPSSVAPPPRAPIAGANQPEMIRPPLPPRVLPPPPSQGQLLYRNSLNPLPPPPVTVQGLQHGRPPPPPPHSIFLPAIPAPFASHGVNSGEDAHPPAMPPPLPPPPPSSPPPVPLSPPPPTSSPSMSAKYHVTPSIVSLDSVSDMSSQLKSGSGTNYVHDFAKQAIASVNEVVQVREIYDVPTIDSGATCGTPIVEDYSSLKTRALLALPLPPPKPADKEMVRRIEVLCQFIARNGPCFEDMACKREENNPEYAFLFGGQPGTEAAIAKEYFQWLKRKCFMESNLSKEADHSSLSTRLSEFESSKDPNGFMIEGTSRSPADSDMDMEEHEPSSVNDSSQKPSTPLKEDLGSTTAASINYKEALGSLVKCGSPIRLLQDYVSDESAEDDVPSFEDVSPVRALPSVTDTSLHEGFEYPTDVPSRKPNVSPKPLKVVETTVLVSNVSDTIAKTSKLQNDNPKNQISNNLFSKDASQGDTNFDPQLGNLGEIMKDGIKQGPTSVKVDEFGRLLREGASDSDSDGSRYTARRARRGRSRSRSQSPGDRRMRKSRSPRRRKEKRNRSRSWSPKKRRSRSKSPPSFRHIGDYGGDKTRRERDQVPDCFDFLRGRCYRGASCRFLHHGSANSDARRYRGRQQQYVEVSRDLRNSVSCTDSLSSFEIQEGSKAPEKVSVYQHDTCLKEDIKSSEMLPSMIDVSKDVSSMDDLQHVTSSEVVESPSAAIREVGEPDSQVAVAQGPEGEPIQNEISRPHGKLSQASTSDSLPIQFSTDAGTLGMPDKTRLLGPPLDDNPMVQPTQTDASAGQPSQDAKMLHLSRPPVAPDVQSVPLEMPHSYQAPVRNEHHQTPTPLQPSWTSLPPPPSHMHGSTSSSVIQSTAFPPTQSQHNPMPMMRPYMPGEPSHSHVVGFHSQTFPLPGGPHRPSYDIEHFRPKPVPFDNMRGQTFGGPDIPGDERFTHSGIHEGSQSQPGPPQDSFLHPRPQLQREHPLPLQVPDNGQNFQPLPNQKFASPFPAVTNPSSFISDAMHSQPLPFSKASPAKQMQSFPGGNLLSTSSSMEGYGAASTTNLSYPQHQHSSFSMQHSAAESFHSHLGPAGSTDPSVRRYPLSFLDSSMPLQSSLVGGSKISTTTHYNPFASTFERPPGSTIFNSSFRSESEGQIFPRFSASLPIAPAAELRDVSQTHRHIVEGFVGPQSQIVREPSVGDQYDPLFDSIEPSSKTFRKFDHVEGDPSIAIVNRPFVAQDTNVSISMLRMSSSHGIPDTEEKRQKEVAAIPVTVSPKNDEFGETTIDAEGGAVESGSTENLGDLGNADTGDIEIDQVQSKSKSKKNKDSRSVRLFKIALADFVKEVLKPSWRQGNMSKEAFKTIVKKTVDKVSGSMKKHHIPKSQAKINQYVESSQRKLTKLVMGYVDKYVKV